MAAGSVGPAVILAGADEQSTRHLGRLTAVCERYDIPLVRTFSRLTEESARHLDTRHTAFMRLATRPEALRAAEHIGLERRFVAGRFSHSHSVSRSRTRTTSESWTQTSGRTEGEATTHTTGTTTGQAYSEAEVPRHDQQVHVHVEDHRPQPESRDPRRDEPDHRATGRVREPSGGEGDARGRDGQGRDARQDKSVRDGAEKGTGVRGAAGVRDAAEERTADPRPRDRAGFGLGRFRWFRFGRQASGRFAGIPGPQGRQAADRHREDQDLVHRPARERREDQVLVDDRGDQPHQHDLQVADRRRERRRRDHLRARLRPQGPAGNADGAPRGPDARPAHRRGRRERGRQGRHGRHGIERGARDW